MNAITIENVECGYDRAPVIGGVSLDVPRGEFLGILGPNGSGKTTLLRAATGVIAASAGRITVNGADIRSLGPRDIARQVACVMQDNAASVGAGHLAFAVRDVVTMGRTPYLSRAGWATPRDRDAVDRAMELAEVTHLADRPITELSGGERQRAFIAMALAQECDIIMLDEPTSHLDIAHQIGILDLFAGLNRDSNKTIVGVFHDLNLASEYCERLLLLKDGQVAAVGKPEEIFTPEMIRSIYGARVAVQPSPATGRPHVFLRKSLST